MHGHALIISCVSTYEHILKDGIFLEVGSDRETGSTKILAKKAKELNTKFITVDPDEGAFNRAKSIVKSIDESFEAVQDLGEEWIAKYEGEKFSLVYLDAFDNVLDFWPHKQTTIDTYTKRGTEITNENAWNMHLKAAEALLGKIVPNGLICFDDTVQRGSDWNGKGKLAVPFLLENGYDIVENDYNNCLILQEGK
jgi:hypothetical protein